MSNGQPGGGALRGDRTRAAALWSCYLAGFATLLDAAVIAYTAADVADGLGATTAQLQWFLASFSLTFGLGLVPAGRLGDALGRRGLLVLGLTVFFLGAAASALAPDIGTVVAARLVQGLGAGIISAQVLGIIQDLTTGTQRVQALARYTAAGAVAALAGPLLAGLILSISDASIAWRLLLALPVLPTLLTILLAARGVPKDRRRAGPTGLDLPGIALLGLVVILLTLPVLDLELPPLLLLAALVAAACSTGALIAWEHRYARRGRTPLFAPALVRSSGFVCGNIAAMLWFGANLGSATAMTVHFLGSGKVEPLLLASAFGLGAVSRFAASALSRTLYLRFGSRVILFGLIVQTLCFAALTAAALSMHGSELFITFSVLQIALGVSSGIVEPVLRSVVLGFAPSHIHGAAASLLQLTQRMAATFFVALTSGILFGIASDRPETALAVAIAVCGLAGGLATVFAGLPVIRLAESGRSRPRHDDRIVGDEDGEPLRASSPG